MLRRRDASNNPHRGLDPRLLIAIAVSTVAGLIHLWVSPFHFRVSIVYGLLIVVGGLLQIIWGVAAWRDPSRDVLSSIIAVNLGVATAWLVSRLIGLPGRGDWPIAGIDVAVTVDELFVALGAVVVIRSAGDVPTGRRLTALEVVGIGLLLVSLAMFLRGFGYGRYA